MSDFDLSSVREAAIATLQATPESTPEAAPEATPSPAAPPSTDTPVAPTTPTAAELRKFKVKVDGSELEVDEQELLNGYSRTASYTKRMQALAEERKQIEAINRQLQEREQTVNQFMRDPENVAKYYAYLTGQQLQAQAQAVAQAQSQTPNAPPPDEIATVENAAQIAARQAAKVQEELQRQIAAVQGWTKEQIAQAQTLAQMKQTAVEYQGKLSAHINTLLDEHPILKGVDGIEDVLAADAAKLDPSNLQEAMDALKNVAVAKAEKLNAHLTELNKRQIVEQQKLTALAPEPPGGVPAAPVPQSFRLGDKGLTRAAVDYLNSMNKTR